MRKVLILLTLFLVLCSEPVFGQDKKSPDYYQDLLRNYRRYQGLLEPFNTAQSRHLAYQSVETQAEFLSVCKSLILSEIEAISSYAIFIRSYLAEATQILFYEENVIYIKLDDEISYLAQVKERAKNLSSLGSAQDLMTELEEHYQKIDKMGYEIKAAVELGSIKKVFSNLKIERDKLEGYLGEVEDSDLQANSLNAAKEKFADLDQEIQDSEALLSKAAKTQKGFSEDNPKGISQEVDRIVEQATAKIRGIIFGYQNIVFNLK